MKVLIINGSPRKGGNTAIALDEITKILNEEQIEVINYQIGTKEVRGCIACNYCRLNGHCVFNDKVVELASIFEQVDGVIIASPVYFASANGSLISLLDRLFYSTTFDKRMKVGASIAVARRGGCSATFDQLNKYFTISGMPVVSSQYWNSVHGHTPGEASQDIEGMQTMRTLAHNMAFLIKSIALGKAHFGLPAREEKIHTNFIR